MLTCPRPNVPRRRGAALLLVLIALAMATILALSFLASQGPATVVASNADRKAKARQIAESALQMAIDYVNEDTTWRSDKSSGTWMSSVSLDGGTFTLTGIDEDDGDLSDDSSEVVTLSVVATYQGVTHRVSARVTPPAEDDPANRLLFVVGVDSSSTPHDPVKQTLFESWGYTVTVFDSTESQAVYDAAVAVNDVVYISESVYASSVSTKLRSVTIGVVNDEGYLTDDFGLTTSNTTSDDTTTSIEIIDNSHPITTGFSAGSLTVMSSSDIIGYASSSLASGVTTLADRAGSNSEPVLIVADTGDTLHYGAAEGRRVMLASASGLDFSSLNSDGQLIVRRALDWAASGATPAAGEPTLLALYEFEQVTVTPTLAGRWPLDEEPEGGSGMVFANDDIDFTTGTVIDSYNSSTGPYGGSNIGSAAIVVTNSGSSSRISGGTINGDAYCDASATPTSVITSTVTGTKGNLSADLSVPSYSAPGGSFTNMGSHTYSGGTHTWSSNLDFDDLTITNSATINVSGNVTIHVDQAFTLDNNSTISLNAGASLTMYVDDNIEIKNGSTFGSSEDAASIRLIKYSTSDDFKIIGSSTSFSGTIESEDDIYVESGAQIYGAVLSADDLYVYDGSDIHVDTALNTYGGTPATFGESSSSGSSYDTVENDVAATQFTLTEAMTVTSISAYLWGADDGGAVRFAIYDDNSGTPGTLLAETARESLSEESWQWETESIGPVNLSAGTYWLALSLEGDDGTARYRYQSGGTTHHENDNAVDNGYDASWGTTMSTLSHTISIYASGTTSSGAPATTVDTSTLANDGTVNGGPSAGITGQHGTAFQFDGVDDYVEIPHDDTYLMDAGTFSVWFKADSTPSGNHHLFSKDSSGYDTGGHFSVYLYGDRLRVRMQSVDTSYIIESASGSIATDTWYHAMFAWGEGGMALFINGVLVDSDPYTGGLATTSGGVGNYEPITLGGGTQLSGNLVATPVNEFFDGTLDDLRIYNERLTQSQALEIYGGATEPSPIQSESIVEDTSGYGDALTLAITETDDVAWASGTVTFTGDTQATSLLPATKLHDAIEATGEFSVEVLLTRATPGGTDSPSRIVSFADGASAHNFMLGQDAAKYEARVRDSSTGTNGALSPEFVSTTDLNSSGDTHIVLSYKDGDVSVFIDGTLDETNTAGGILNNWDNDHYLVFGGAYGGGSHWNGTLKRVAIYDRGFNATQANNVYNGSDPGDGSSSSGAGTAVWDEQD